MAQETLLAREASAVREAFERVRSAIRYRRWLVDASRRRVRAKFGVDPLEARDGTIPEAAAEFCDRFNTGLALAEAEIAAATDSLVSGRESNYGLRELLAAAKAQELLLVYERLHVGRLEAGEYRAREGEAFRCERQFLLLAEGL
jgi:hypothetical protein